MSGVRCVTADKEHRCTECGRLIPVGDKYWKKFDPKRSIDRREHTNCLEYRGAELLNPNFNKDRSQRRP